LKEFGFPLTCEGGHSLVCVAHRTGSEVVVQVLLEAVEGGDGGEAGEVELRWRGWQTGACRSHRPLSVLVGQLKTQLHRREAQLGESALPREHLQQLVVNLRTQRNNFLEMPHVELEFEEEVGDGYLVTVDDPGDVCLRACRAGRAVEFQALPWQVEPWFAT
jgi:hypothetical protein